MDMSNANILKEEWKSPDDIKFQKRNGSNVVIHAETAMRKLEKDTSLKPNDTVKAKRKFIDIPDCLYE